jgi:hypothetical protein
MLIAYLGDVVPCMLCHCDIKSSLNVMDATSLEFYCGFHI